MKITPKRAFATAFLYLIAVDEKVEKWESIQLKTALRGLIKEGKTGDFVKECIEYANKNSFEEFIQESSKLLNRPQKLCILLNLLDSISFNGRVEPDAEISFRFISKLYGFKKKQLKPFEEMITIKNNKSVFK
jgi:hypothetical protein